jgi:Holliday junction resolvasome RuvABC DNA-binding subunit
LRDGRAAWPLANAQHLVISAGMYDVQTDTRSLGALHVGILALVALGHSHAAIARALKSATRKPDARQVRKTIELAGKITLADLYAQ